MAHLKITTPNNGKAAASAGYAAQVWLNGQEISADTHRVELIVDVDRPIMATIHVYVGTLELDTGTEVDMRLVNGGEKRAMGGRNVIRN
jgi:hypothetical protein